MFYYPHKFQIVGIIEPHLCCHKNMMVDSNSYRSKLQTRCSFNLTKKHVSLRNVHIVIKRCYIMGHYILPCTPASNWTKSLQHAAHPPCFISRSFPNQKSIINILHRQPQKCQVCGCPAQELPLKRPKPCHYNFGDNDSLKMFTVMSIGRRGLGMDHFHLSLQLILNLVA